MYYLLTGYYKNEILLGYTKNKSRLFMKFTELL